MKEHASAQVKQNVQQFYNALPMSHYGVLQKLAQAKKLKGKKVLDAGCGSGWFLFDYLMYGAEVTGVDNSQGSIAFIKEQADTLSLAPTLVHGDLETVELPAQSFDNIFCIYVLMHTPHPVEVLKNFKRWIKPDGEIKLIISHKYNIDVLVAKVISLVLKVAPFLSKLIPLNIRKRVHWEDRFEHPYWNQMSKSEVEKLCADAGLTIQEIKVYGFTTFFVGYFIPPIINKALDALLGRFLGRAISVIATAGPR
jgi:ubiquinone/menaquinone biosynthesis C-methylase UbiE